MSSWCVCVSARVGRWCFNFICNALCKTMFGVNKGNWLEEYFFNIHIFALDITFCISAFPDIDVMCNRPFFLMMLRVLWKME